MGKLFVVVTVFLGGFCVAAALHLHGAWCWAPSAVGVVLAMGMGSKKG